MSSISFPNHSTPSLGSSSQHEDPYYSPNGFDASSSFQMNPLSSHPPRTPRTSIISNASTYQASTIGGHDDHTEKVDIDENDFDEEEERVREVEKKVWKEDIWKEIILTSNGRDKALVSFERCTRFLTPSLQSQIETNTVFNTRIPSVPPLHIHCERSQEAKSALQP